jgi:hypothetical protein
MDSSIEPDLSTAALPVARTALPVLPEEDVPDKNLKDPEVPRAPALTDATTIDPDDVEDPYPVLTETDPPEVVEDVPA